MTIRIDESQINIWLFLTFSVSYSSGDRRNYSDTEIISKTYCSFKSEITSRFEYVLHRMIIFD